jgi:hypothetical protein
MKFLVKYYVGDSLREKKITALDLDNAEQIANKKFKNWDDIFTIIKVKKCKNTK